MERSSFLVKLLIWLSQPETHYLFSSLIHPVHASCAGDTTTPLKQQWSSSKRGIEKGRWKRRAKDKVHKRKEDVKEWLKKSDLMLKCCNQLIKMNSEVNSSIQGDPNSIENVPFNERPVFIQVVVLYCTSVIGMSSVGNLEPEYIGKQVWCQQLESFQHQ